MAFDLLNFAYTVGTIDVAQDITPGVAQTGFRDYSGLSASNTTYVVLTQGSKRAYVKVQKVGSILRPQTYYDGTNGEGATVTFDAGTITVFTDLGHQHIVHVDADGNAVNAEAVLNTFSPATLVALKTTPLPSSGETIVYLREISAGSKDGAFYVWDPTETATGDDFTYVVSSLSATGRWVRQTAIIGVPDLANDAAAFSESIYGVSDDLRHKDSNDVVKKIPRTENYHQGEFETFAEWQALASTQWTDGQTFVFRGILEENDLAGQRITFTWDASSTNTDALGVTHLRPDDISGSNAGRAVLTERAAAPKFTDSDATPSMAGGRIHRCADTVPAAITALDDMVDGEPHYIYPGAQAQVFTHGGALVCENGADFTLATNAPPIVAISDNGVVYLMTGGISRAAASALITADGSHVVSIPAADVGGTGDAIAITATGGPALADGLTLSFIPGAANSGAVTVNYNAGGALALVDEQDAALNADALTTTAPVIIRYTSSGTKWRRVSGGATAGSVYSNVVSEYGATGDGVTDDTTAVTAAFTAGGPLYFPAGTYLIDPVTISATVDVYCDPAAIFKRRSGTTDTHALIQISGDNSRWIGGQFDGDRDTVSWTSGLWFELRAYQATGVIIRDVYIKDGNYTGFGANECDDIIIDGIVVENCSHGFNFGEQKNGKFTNCLAKDIHNQGNAINVKGFTFGADDSCHYSNFTIWGLSGDTSMPSPSKSSTGFGGIDHDDCIYENFSVIDCDSSEGTIYHLCVSMPRARGCVFKGFQIIGFNGVGIEFNGHDDNVLTDFIIDRRYQENDVIEDTNHGGLYIHGNGWYEDRSSRPLRRGRGMLVSDGKIMSCAVGVVCEVPTTKFVNVESYANTSHGFLIDDGGAAGTYGSNVSLDDAIGIELINCKSRFNQRSGVAVEQGGVTIMGGDYSNNGTDTSLADSVRGAIVYSGSETVNSVRIGGGAQLSSTVDTTSVGGGISYEPGASATDFPYNNDGHHVKVTFIKPTGIELGARVNLINAVSGPADVEGIVRRYDLDEAWIYLPGGSATLIENTASVTGTWTTDGTDDTQLNGTSGAALTDLPGRFWIKSGSEWRQVIAVTDDDTVLIDQAFTTPLSGATIVKSVINFELVETQTYGTYNLEHANVTAVRIEDVLSEGNTVENAHSIRLNASGNLHNEDLASGVITIRAARFSIDSEDANPDTWTDFDAKYLKPGDIVIFGCASASRAITVAHNSGGGKIRTIDSSDIVLDSANNLCIGSWNGSTLVVGPLNFSLSAGGSVSDLIPNQAAMTELTIASNEITPDQGSHFIDTESNAAADDLDNIVATNFKSGDFFIASQAAAGRVITIRHNTGGGNIRTADSANITLDNAYKIVMFRLQGSNWIAVKMNF